MRRLTRGSFFVEGCLRALTREVCFRERCGFQPSGNENCHIFMATSSPSLAHLPLHGRIFPLIFPFIGTSSLSGRWGGAWAGHGLLPRELSRGFRRDTRGTLSEKRRIKFMARLQTLSFPRFAYADCLREDYREASAKCLRVPTRTCKYQCFGFRGVNMSSPHKKVPSFQKKTWLKWLRHLYDLYTLAN